LRVKKSLMYFAGASHGVPTRQTGVIGPRVTVPCSDPRRSETAEANAITFHRIVTDT
jgi:hypothetical protein